MYYLLLTLIVGLGIFLCEIKPGKYKTLTYLAICLVAMVTIVTFRYGLGYDFYSYRDIFNGIAETASIGELLMSSDYRAYPLFALIAYAIGAASLNYIWFNAVIGMLIFGLAVLAIYQYSKNAWISVFSYVALLFFYMGMNFVRQSLALSIIMLSYPYLKAKKFFPYSAFILIASCIHFYALIMIPAYFLLISKPTAKYYMVMTSIGLFAFATSTQILNFLASVSPKVKIYVETFYLQQGSNFRIALLPITYFLVLLAFKKVLLKQDTGNSIFLNLAFYGVLFNIMAVKHSILARFSDYFLIFMVFAFSEIAYCLRPVIVLDTDKHKEQSREKRLLKQNLKAQWFNYRWYVCSLILVLMINHTLAAVNNFHGVFPYHTIYNEDWKRKVDYIYYEYGNGQWPLWEIDPEELPKEFR